MLKFLLLSKVKKKTLVFLYHEWGSIFIYFMHNNLSSIDLTPFIIISLCVILCMCVCTRERHVPVWHTHCIVFVQISENPLLLAYALQQTLSSTANPRFAGPASSRDSLLSISHINIVMISGIHNWFLLLCLSRGFWRFQLHPPWCQGSTLSTEPSLENQTLLLTFTALQYLLWPLFSWLNILWNCLYSSPRVCWLCNLGLIELYYIY